jgi:formamidopyrimidine-DNA glycosylase
MFELPECATLARQMTESLRGKTVRRGRLGNSPHKFVWYNRKPAEFERLTRGKMVGAARARGGWMFVPLEPGYVLTFGECGGQMLFHGPGSAQPAKYHLLLEFDDGSALSVMTRMWGAMELHEQGRELERKYVKDMRPTPLDPEFTFDYFSRLVGDLRTGKKRSAKALITQEQLIPGLGNSIAQDILFRAGLHPRHPIGEMSQTQERRLYDAIMSTVREAVAKGGRSDEFDLHGRPGGYQRVMDSKAAGTPCPQCGARIEKSAYLGGSCYFCPDCQI